MIVGSEQTYELYLQDDEGNALDLTNSTYSKLVIREREVETSTEMVNVNTTDDASVIAKSGTPTDGRLLMTLGASAAAALVRGQYWGFLATVISGRRYEAAPFPVRIRGGAG